MHEGLWMISMAMIVLIAQSETALPEEPSKVTQITSWLDQVPLLGWGLAVFVVFTMAVAAIAALTGNLDKIFNFKNKYLSRAKPELSAQLLAHLREQLLQQIGTNVAGRLEDSLHNLIRVDLEQEEQRYQVGRRKAPLVEVNRKKPLAFQDLIQRGLSVFKKNPGIRPVEPAEKTYAIFHRTDIGRRLLILGEPGAGKTTELLTIAQRLVDEATEDESQPIPLLFELSSWTPEAPISIWLSQQLNTAYGVAQKLSEPLIQRLIERNQLLLLLDGLDELGQEDQVACINALEEFLDQHPALPAIICCRREEYEQGGQQLKQLNGAIYLQSVGPKQIHQYLNDLGQEQLWTDIQAMPELLELAKSPLFLTMLVIAYQGQPIRDTTSLFNAYIYKQLHELNHGGTYKPGNEKSPQQTLHYLTWLARQLKKRNETEFLIENLQPDWLASKKQKRTYTLSLVLICVLLGAFIGPIVSIFNTWESSGGSAGRLWTQLFFSLFGGLRGKVSKRLFFGLSGALFGALSGALVGNFISLSPIEYKEQIKWNVKDGLLGALAGVLSGALMGALVGTLYGALGGALTSGLWNALFGALVGFLIGSLSYETVNQKQCPNQGIQKSLQNGLRSALFGALLGALGGGTLWGGTLWNILYSGLLGALFGALFGGLFEGMKHYILRIVLSNSKDTPWNYAQFLEHAARHRFIQRTGGRYRFVHDLLRQHFSQMTPEQQAILAQSPRN